MYRERVSTRRGHVRGEGINRERASIGRGHVRGEGMYGERALLFLHLGTIWQKRAKKKSKKKL